MIMNTVKDKLVMIFWIFGITSIFGILLLLLWYIYIYIFDIFMNYLSFIFDQSKLEETKGVNDKEQIYFFYSIFLFSLFILLIN